jgi:uncharacterized protein
MTLPTNTFGKTGVTVPKLGLGCGPIGFGNVPHEHGVEVVRRALDLGVTYLDTAHHYESERIVGDALRGRRDDAFVVTKTVKRNYAAAWSDINLSLEQLQTDHIDVLHMHCVNTIGDLNAVLGPGGSLEAAIEARQQGLVRFIGITGHARPNILALALERFPFDAVLIAMGALDALVTDPMHFFMPAARVAGCGVSTMKILGGGRLNRRPDLALRYAMNLDGAHVAVVGTKTIEELEIAVKTASDPRPLTGEEEQILFAEARAIVREKENLPFWLTDAQVVAYRADWAGSAL